MVGTKIFVLRLRDVIKYAAIVLGGLIVLGALVYFFLSGRGGSAAPSQMNPAARYIPGSYSATIMLNDRPLDVIVTVSENEIVAVEMSEMYESQRMLFPLFETMMERVSDDVLFYQRADIVIQNDFPVTTGLLQQAVVVALEQARP